MKLYKTFIAALGLTLTLALGGITTKAAEFSVTEVSAILYTNSETALLSDADDSTVVVPTVEAGLPVSVTGVTSNGYFRIDIGGTTWYVPGIGLSAATDTTATADTTTTTATATSESSTGWTQEAVYNALMYLKETKYPDMSAWWGAGSDFVAAVWQDVFGIGWSVTGAGAYNAITYDYTVLKVGDVVEFYNNVGTTQYGVIVSIEGDMFVLAEGNVHFNNGEGVVYWENKATASKLHNIVEYADGMEDWGIFYWTAY